MVTVWFGVGQFLSGAMGQLYPGGDINEKFSEKDVLESGKKDLENIFDKSTEVYNYFIEMIELIESENKK